MEELIQAASATALDAPGRPRPNQLFQGVLAFLAVVGIGAAATVIVRPPVRLRVITVEKRLPPISQNTERMRPQSPLPPPLPVLLPPQKRSGRAPAPPPKSQPRTVPTSFSCNDDPLCGLELKE